ncbi:PCM1 protein, partial [Atractosteus spatula]|nr:PCM1 protein [Atractosteus spatula]
MATGGVPFDDGVDDQELPNWSISNGSLDDRLNNMDWGVQQKKANRSSEKNKKKLGVAESRLTNDISPESTPGASRRRARTPHSFSHVKYATQMSVPEQAELERLKQRINFTDLDERSIGSDSQGRATAANNQRQVAENKKAFNFLPLHVNTNKSKEVPASAGKDSKKQSPGKDPSTSVLSKDPFQGDQGSQAEDGRGEPGMDSSQGRDPHGEAKEELENLRRQHDLLKKMLQQQEQLRALQGRQAALLAMQHNAEQAGAGVDDAGMRQRHPVPSPSVQRASPASCLNCAGECPPPDRKVVTETTGSVSGLSITSELNDELNDLIQRFHNQLHDSQAKAVPDNRRQAESLSLSREVSRSRNAPASEPPSAGNAKLVKLKELQDKKHTMDKILQELHSLRDQTLNNKSFPAPSVSSQRGADRRGVVSVPPAPPGRSAAVNVEANSLSSTARLDSVASPNESEGEDNVNPTDKLRKLKEVHKRLNELRELVHYYEQTSDMMVDTVNENIKDDDEKTEGSLFESLFDSDHENPEPITNIRNPQRAGNWLDMNSLTNAHSTNNRDGRLNTDCEINNRSAANLRSLNIPSVIECQYNRDRPYNEVKDTKDEEWLEDEDGQERDGSEGSGSSRRSSLEEEEDPEFVQKIHRLHTAKQKLRHLQELVAMVQSDDTDGTTANASSVTEDDGLNQQPNNTRTNDSKLKKDIALKEKAREKFYEAKLKQQQKELKQLQDERQRLMEIQEKIQDLQWACPDLQLSVSSTMSQPTSKRLPAAASTPAVNTNDAVLKSTVEPGSVSVPDNELWSEMRRHQILREELRQRRKQLELLMAEHQRRKVLNDSASKNGDAQMQDPQHPSRNDRTMATWGGSTQCALDEDEDGYPSEETAQEEEEEEEEEGQSSSCEDAAPYSCRNTRHRGTRKQRESSWKSSRPLSTDGNARPSPSSRQQQNISMRRQENLRWASELSFVEEKQHWQEQISQLKKQLDFSTTMCQTLMQDQQTLSYMLQTLLTSPYGVLPNNVGSPQVHLIMHQLNQCYAQLAWQQNNVQRLKKMLNDLLNQENSQQPEQAANRDPGVCSASPNLFSPFNLHPHLSSLNMPGLANFAPVTAGFSFNPVFPPVFGEFPQSSAPQAGTEQPQTVDHNTSVKTEYMAFPQPFESSSLNGVERKSNRNSKEGEGDRQGAFWHGGAHNEKAEGPSSVVVDKTTQSQRMGKAQPVRNGRSRQFDEESLESFSSMPDPIDPTTVTKTFKSRKAAAQASLASKDKTPKSKNKRKRSNGQNKPFGGVNMGQESDSVSSANEYNRVRSPHSKQKEESEKILDKRTQDQLDTKLTCSKSNDLSSANVWRASFHSNRNACTEAPDTSSDFSLFETLRETIYSEVATLISQNESRPHFLIELFHELQMLNTDYLRQRALYALQDIVTRHLTEKKDTNEEQAASLSSAAWAASNSELTPSESLATSDGEVSEKNTENKLNLSRKHNGGDTEFMDNESTLSTSSNLEPFANDDLGNTVIHLDKALARIREYERMKLRAEYNENAADSSAVEQGVADGLEGASATPPGLTGQISSDIPCPRIDTQQLDRQIKAIMREVIPFLKEHMDDICSSQLLISIRRMVLTLTQQNDESKEFVRFFHKQLGGILQDSLSKFAGRTLKECGEDLLVEISEILFNELAFFRLMQDLDNTSAAVKQKERKKSDTTSSKQTLKPEERKTPGSEQSLSGVFLDQDKVDPQQGLDVDEPEIKETNQVEVKESMSCDGSDREDEDDDEDSGRLPLSISLSKAETQALTNYGSGEDENEDEELEEFEAGPVDVQTSLQASSDAGCEHEQVTDVISWNASQEVKSDQESVESPEDKSEALKLADSREAKEDAVNTKDESVPPPPKNEGTAADTGEAQLESGSTTLTPESSVACSPDTDSPVLINDYEAGSGNLSQKSDEDDFVKVEDLPLQLSVLCEDELQKRIAEEQESNSLSSEIIQGGGDGLVELVGNAQTLKEPETIGAQSA